MSLRMTPDGYITEQGFIEYYADINACLPAEKDDYFVDMVLKTWGMSIDKSIISAKKNWRNWRNYLWKSQTKDSWSWWWRKDINEDI